MGRAKGGGRTHVSTGLAVVPPLGDGVERLLALHAQGHLLLPDWRRCPFAQLHTALRAETGWSSILEEALVMGAKEGIRKEGGRGGGKTP